MRGSRINPPEFAERKLLAGAIFSLELLIWEWRVDLARSEHMSIRAGEFTARGPRNSSCYESKEDGIASAFVTAGDKGLPAHESFEVVVTQLDVTAEAIDVSATLLSELERQRAKQFVFIRERNRFIAARARLRRLLAQRLGVAPQAIELQWGTRGKPALAQCRGWPDLRFNVSHCEDVAAYAFSLGSEIGIDIEAVRVIHDADNIAARFFSRCEIETYRNLDLREKPLGFFNCWTRKEAFIKALGEGLFFPLDLFDVSLVPGELAQIQRFESIPGDECGWKLFSFAPLPGYVGAVVVEIPARQGDSGLAFARSNDVRIMS